MPQAKGICGYARGVDEQGIGVALDKGRITPLSLPYRTAKNPPASKAISFSGDYQLYGALLLGNSISFSTGSTFHALLRFTLSAAIRVFTRGATVVLAILMLSTSVSGWTCETHTFIAQEAGMKQAEEACGHCP